MISSFRPLWILWLCGLQSNIWGFLHLHKAITLKPWGVMWHSTYHRKWYDKHYPSRIVSLTNSLILISLFHIEAWVVQPYFKDNSTAKSLTVRDFTIRGPLWSSSICTSFQPWQGNNESYLHQKNLGPLPKALCYQAFFKGWHQWQPTLINKIITYLVSTSLIVLPTSHW